MSVCGDKVCEAKTKACCESIIASICGDRGLDFPTSSCKPLRLEGVTDTTINQGVGIDLTDGIHAYDGNGDEIPFEVEPDTIDKCDVGEHLVKYTASGQGASMRPSLCGDNALAVSDACNDLTTIEKDRIVTITQANPPTINGIDMEELPINSTFDPTEGVSAVDDNGNIIPYEYSGTYDKEASGEIASFETEYAQSAKSLEVSLEPIQDLNGYDKPWSGGNGENKYQILTISKTSGSPTVTTSEESYIINGSATAYGQSASSESFTLEAGTYSFKAFTASGSGTVNPQLRSVDGLTTYASSSISTFTLTEATEIVPRITWNAGTFTNLEIKLKVVEGSTAPTSWTPYSNICPIYGRTEVVTQRTGKNLLDNTDFRTYTNWSASAVNYGNYSMSAYNKGYILPAVGGETHTLSFDISASSFPQYLYLCRGNGATSERLVAFTTGSFSRAFYTFTAEEEWTYYLRMGSTSNSDLFDGQIATIGYAQLELGTTATSYELYQGNTYTTALGRTVYGGTLEQVGGQLTDKMGIVDLGTLTWQKVNVTSPYFQASYSPTYKYEASQTNFLCSQYSHASIGSSGSTEGIFLTDGNYIRIRDLNYTSADATAFKTAMNGVQLCYELATPQTYQLTPQEVSLLQGENNVWSDGDVTVMYSANIPQGEAYEYIDEDVYRVYYTAEDECGNKTEATRIIVVGDGNSLCNARICNAFIECD